MNRGRYYYYGVRIEGPVRRRISFTTCSAGAFAGTDFCLICAPERAKMNQKISLQKTPRFVPWALTPDSVRGLGRPAPRGAGGEHEAQLPWSRLFQSISPFAPPAFAGFPANMKRSDFCVDIVPSSLPPSGLPLARTHADLPG